MTNNTSSIARLPSEGARVKKNTQTKPIVHLTQRQKDVLRLISEGHSTKSIARELNIAQGTVKVHTAAIFRELDVCNRTQAATKARDILTDDEDPLVEEPQRRAGCQAWRRDRWSNRSNVQ